MQTLLTKDEIFDIVNENDEVIGTGTRKDIHQKKLMHRAVHAIFFNWSRNILLQKRSMGKDTFPGVWTTSCSGHVDSGESYEDALIRECKEELGVSLKLSDFKYIGKVPACEETGFEFTQVYTITNTGPFMPSFSEVQSLDWMPVDMFEIQSKIMPRDFTPSLIKVYNFYKNVEK
jgi:isopentenyl-diphosphate delta-isomerase type 1